MKGSKGFTLLELVVTMAVVAISMHTISESYQNMVNSNRLNTVAMTLGSDLHLARNEAVTRNTRVTLKKSGEGWEHGWRIFVDGNHNAEMDQHEELLKEQQPFTHPLTLRGNRPVREYLSYVGSGLTRTKRGGFQAGTFLLCDSQAESSSEHARAIIISSSGRPRISNDKVDLKKRSCGV